MNKLMHMAVNKFISYGQKYYISRSENVNARIALATTPKLYNTLIYNLLEIEHYDDNYNVFYYDEYSRQLTVNVLFHPVLNNYIKKITRNGYLINKQIFLSYKKYIEQIIFYEETSKHS